MQTPLAAAALLCAGMSRMRSAAWRLRASHCKPRLHTEDFETTRSQLQISNFYAGVSLERALGSVAFMHLIMLLVVLGDAAYVFFSFIAAFGPARCRSKCCCSIM